MAYWEEEEEEDEEENESYLSSYSDLVTDLMAVFVLLLSFALLSQGVKVRETAEKMAGEIAAEQLEQAGIEIRDVTTTALPEGDVPGTSAPTTQPTSATSDASITLISEETTGEESDESDNTLYEAIRAYIETSGLSDELSVTKQTDKMILLRVHSSIFFELGSADIASSADQILEDVSKIFVEYEEHIRQLGIEGHTDNLPIKTEQFDSNWELSTARAVNVLRRVLEVSGLDPSKFSAVGLGEFHPIADNETEEGRAQNRRVDFIIETYGD